jgi:Ca2+-binding EF-hand superfamily protein
MLQQRVRRIAPAILLAAMVAFTTTLPAAAEDIDDPAVITQRWFERNDLDKNGYLTAEEIVSGRDKQLRRVDIDGDGYISLDEYRYGLPDDRPNQSEWLEAQFAQMDQDGDDLVSADEYFSYGPLLIAESDSDADGMVSLDEYFAVMLP